MTDVQTATCSASGNVPSWVAANNGTPTADGMHLICDECRGSVSASFGTTGVLRYNIHTFGGES